RAPRIARTRKATTAMPLTRKRMVRSLTLSLSSMGFSSLGQPSDAVRALCLLTGGVGADRRALEDEPGVDRHLATGDFGREPVEAPGGRPALLLADPAVLRAVAGALEPLRRLAPRHPTAEMDALLVEHHDAGLHLGEGRLRVRLLGLPQRVGRIRVDVGPGLRHVVRLLLVGDGGEDVLDIPGLDLAAESAAEARPQETDDRQAEAAEHKALGGHDAAIEELPTADRQRLRIGGRLPEADEAAGGGDHRLAPGTG